MLFRNRKWIVAGLMALGVIFIWLGLLRPVTVILDGIPVTVSTRSLTAGGVLRQNGIEVRESDRLRPSKSHLVGWNDVIQLDRSVPVSVGIAFVPYIHQSVSPERIPANLLFNAGVALFPGDRIIWNGQPVAFDSTLPPSQSYSLLNRRAVQVNMVVDGVQNSLSSSAASLTEALWDAGFHLQQSDFIGSDTNTMLTEDTTVSIASGNPVKFLIGEQELTSRTSAASVGEALAQAHLALSGLDYTIPEENAPIPENGEIQIVRVNEEVILEQEVLPFSKEYVEDPNTELDQTSIVDPGAFGLQVSRIRVRYENGEEVSRNTEGEWVAVEPKTQKIGYGTKIVIRTLDTPGGVIEYWRAIPVYATSYAPCKSGVVGKCFYGTSLGLPVQRGVIGVIRSWYNLLAGQSVYVPGYGPATIADTGGGDPWQRLD